MRLAFVLLFGVLTCSAMSPLEARLDQRMRFWQKRLGLEDWSFTVRVVRQSEIDKNAWGTAEWDPQYKTGVINVLDPRDYNLKGGELQARHGMHHCARAGAHRGIAAGRAQRQ